MIVFEVKGNNEMRDRFCKALVGSPAFVNSEIAVCDGKNGEEFFLAVGEVNGNDITIQIDEVKLVDGEENK